MSDEPKPVEDSGWAVAESKPRVAAPSGILSPHKLTPEEKAQRFKQEAGGRGAKLYKISFDDIPPLTFVKSSILKNGYVEGSFVNLVGVPGSGKSRFAIQECIEANLNKLDCLYLYNESVQPKFDFYVRKVCGEMGITSHKDLSHITWADMSKFIQNTADYDSIKNFYYEIWTKKVSSWMDGVDRPSIVVIDSFSNAARKFVPQMYVGYSALVDSLSDTYFEHKKSPITMIIHQKSGSHWERDDDSVVGGQGLIHEGDMSMVFKSNATNHWDAKRYGLDEGIMLHTMMITKDRYQEGEFQETRLLLKNGKLVFGPTVANMVSEQSENTSSIGGHVDWANQP